MKGLHTSWPIGVRKTYRLPIPPRVMFDRNGDPYNVYRGTGIKQLAKQMLLVYAINKAIEEANRAK